jgi:hypothetical protein
MLDFSYTYKFVDALPFGLHVARRDESGEVVTYLSRAASEPEMVAALEWVHAAASATYACTERHAEAS